MPVSIQDGKEDALSYLFSNFNRHARVVDVGAGAGYWGKELKKKRFTNVTALEIHKPYIHQFGLTDIYHRVLNDSVIGFDFTGYDLAIMGDVLEHLAAKDAGDVVNNARRAGCRVLASIPWMCRQGASGGVEHERHLQADLTKENAIERFGNVKWIYCGDKIGVFFS